MRAHFPELRFGHALLAAALIGACTGQIGDPGSSADMGGNGGGTSNGAIDGGTVEGGPPAIPFDPLSVPAYVTKVKALLTGLAPTQAEVDQVAADPSALRSLVDAWMKLPAYSLKMERFFAEAFQQSQAQSLDFQTVIDDGGFTPNDKLLLNFRQSFARTMTELVAEGRPFAEAATTTRFEMTTAMLTYYAYADTSMMTDATEQGSGQKVNRLFREDKNWGFSITKRDIPLASSGDPSSPDYRVFSLPTLAAQYSDGALGEDGAAHCSSIDPVVFFDASSFAFGNNMASWLYSFILGGNFWYFDPPQGKPDAYWCQGGSKFLDRPSHPSLLTSADYEDWRMVTIRPVTASAPQSRFFDIAGNRGRDTLTLHTPRIGYFMTPAFLSQYPTNISNQARATINQTMIVGLGKAFDGADAATIPSPPVDGKHGSDPACFQCHWSLDPMSRLVRSNLTLNYSAQQDPAQMARTGMFLFDGVIDKGTTLADLAKQIAAHPRFKTAWTQKLCEWATSGACLATDPEIARIASVFASKNYDWNALVRELFTSPLVTYAAPTQTTETNGAIVPIARRAQLCAILDNRLGLTDVCGLGSIQTGAGGNTVPAIAAQLPSNGYSRGQVSPLFVNDPDPFFRSSVEQICALAADMVVDAGASPSFSSASAASVATSIAAMAHSLMGLDKTRDAEPIAILKSHYAAAVAAGHKPTDALKSTFTAACTSPWVVTVGQ
jgi:hypothetical protein